jgi:hypothetical protein
MEISETLDRLWMAEYIEIAEEYCDYQWIATDASELAQRLRAAIDVVRASMGASRFDSRSMTQAIMVGELTQRLKPILLAAIEAGGPPLREQN